MCLDPPETNTDGSVDYESTLRQARAGDAAAQYRLGDMCERGHSCYGVEADASQAERWYRKAAEQGLPQAQFQLGLMLAPGEAKYWLSKCKPHLRL